MKDLARKFGFMVTMLTIMMAGFTFAACGSDDDNDPGTDNLEGAGKTGGPGLVSEKRANLSLKAHTNAPT